MITSFSFIRFVLTSVSLVFCTIASAADLQCGDRIEIEDVLVVDMEPYVDQEVLFFEKLNEQAGAFVLISHTPVRVNWAGNKASTTHSVRKSTANLGCDLLVLLGYRITEKRWQGRVITERSLMVHLGEREKP